MRPSDPDIVSLAKTSVSFSMVRHPFERIVSAYEDKVAFSYACNHSVYYWCRFSTGTVWTMFGKVWGQSAQPSLATPPSTLLSRCLLPTTIRWRTFKIQLWTPMFPSQELDAKFCPSRLKGHACCMNVHWAPLTNRSHYIFTFFSSEKATYCPTFICQVVIQTASSFCREGTYLFDCLCQVLLLLHTVHSDC